MSWKAETTKYYIVTTDAYEAVFTGLEVFKSVRISYTWVEGICRQFEGRKIGAIKELRDIVRNRTEVGLPLKDAKEIVEDCWETMGWGEEK